MTLDDNHTPHRYSGAVYALVIGIILVVSMGIVFVSYKLTQEPVNTRSFAQKPSVNQQGKHDSALQIPPQGIKEKIWISFSYDERSDQLHFGSIRGQEGFIFGEYASTSSPDFVVQTFDAQNNILSETEVEVLDEAEQARHESDSHMFESAYNQYFGGGLSSKNQPNSLSHTSLTPNQKLGQTNQDYFVEAEYSPNIDRIEIIPYEGSGKQARLVIDTQMIDHQLIQRGIAETSFQQHTSSVIHGEQSPDNIGILLVSDNYKDHEMQEFYDYVDYFREELSENNVLKDYMDRISMVAVQGKKGPNDTRCEMSGIQIACVYVIQDSELGHLVNQYKSDIVVLVYKRTEEEAQQNQGKIPCNARAAGNLIWICDGLDGPLAIFTHELGHALLALHDEYSYGATAGFISGRNCTWDSTCAEWSHIPNQACSKPCTSANGYKGNVGYLMEGVLINNNPVNDYGPVGSYIGRQILNRWLEITPTPTPTVTPPQGSIPAGCVRDCTCDDPQKCLGVSSCTGSAKACRIIGGSGYCCPVTR